MGKGSARYCLGGALLLTGGYPVNPQTAQAAEEPTSTVQVASGRGDGAFITVGQPEQCHPCSFFHILRDTRVPSCQGREQSKGKDSCWHEGCKQGRGALRPPLHPPALHPAGLPSPAARSGEPGQASRQLRARTCETPFTPHRRILNTTP